MRHVRELSADYGLADSQDAVVELAVERLYREALDAAEAGRGPMLPQIRASAPRCVRSPLISIDGESRPA